MPASDPGARPVFGGRSPPAAATLVAIPDFDLVRSIGRGAYGEVWLARHKTLGTWRAVKVIRRAEFDDERPFRARSWGRRATCPPKGRAPPRPIAMRWARSCTN
ncbi:MAG: hypothetical protein M5U12_28905 [Verrucomicrobia bacterium]|nr:hypothetical protein [Verrucomicrobiota bacterium]